MDRSAILGAFEALFRGTIPRDIPVKEVTPGDMPLAEAVNQLFNFMREIRDFIVPLAKGELSQHPPEVRNFMASPFKELHSRLAQLTWQAEQVAKGDFSQRVDFMGDFSVAFNAMVIALEAKERALNETIQRLEEEEQRYRLLFEEEQDAVAIYDIGSGHFFNVNRTAIERYGYTQEQFLSLTLPDLFRGRAMEMPKMWEEAHPGEPRLFELENWRKDGSSFPVEISVGVFSYGGKSFVCLIIRDITDRKQAEEEKVKLQAQLQQAQKMESLGILAGGVAHDMNNVLGAILGLASASIEGQAPGSSAHQAFGTIMKAAERGGKMVKSLLSLACQSLVEAHELDMNRIIQEEARLLEHTTLSKVRLEMGLASDLRTILGDASSLTHAFMNLFVNAVDAMPASGRLMLQTRNIDSDWIEIVLEDTGTGMPKEVLEKAMDPFFTTKAPGKGTGLGLSLVYNTVKAHHGQMEIQSEPGQGTRVILRFPTCGAAAQAIETAADLRPDSSLGALNVLLVDDDELIQSSTQGILEVLGHTVTGVFCGEEALALLEAGFQPNVVILDLNMPGLGGAGTLPLLRALRPNLPVLLSTGRADQTALDLIDAHPHVTLLPKPFNMGELQQHLKLLGRR